MLLRGTVGIARQFANCRVERALVDRADRERQMRPVKRLGGHKGLLR